MAVPAPTGSAGSVPFYSLQPDDETKIEQKKEAAFREIARGTRDSISVEVEINNKTYTVKWENLSSDQDTAKAYIEATLRKMIELALHEKMGELPSSSSTKKTTKLTLLGSTAIERVREPVTQGTAGSAPVQPKRYQLTPVDASESNTIQATETKKKEIYKTLQDIQRLYNAATNPTAAPAASQVNSSTTSITESTSATTSAPASQAPNPAVQTNSNDKEIISADYGGFRKKLRYHKEKKFQKPDKPLNPKTTKEDKGKEAASESDTSDEEILKNTKGFGTYFPESEDLKKQQEQLYRFEQEKLEKDLKQAGSSTPQQKSTTSKDDEAATARLKEQNQKEEVSKREKGAPLKRRVKPDAKIATPSSSSTQPKREEKKPLQQQDVDWLGSDQVGFASNGNKNTLKQSQKEDEINFDSQRFPRDKQRIIPKELPEAAELDVVMKQAAADSKAKANKPEPKVVITATPKPNLTKATQPTKKNPPSIKLERLPDGKIEFQ